MHLLMSHTEANYIRLVQSSHTPVTITKHFLLHHILGLFLEHCLDNTFIKHHYVCNICLYYAKGQSHFHDLEKELWQHSIELGS